MSANQDLVEFDGLKADVTLFVAPVKDLKVIDSETATKAHEVGAQIKRMQKLLETKRTELVKPLNDRVKQINGYAKEIEAPLANAETHIKAELQRYELGLERQRQEELKAAEEKRRAEEAARQETERKLREESEARHRAEMKRFADEDAARKKLAEEEAAALSLFGEADEEDSKKKTEREAEEARRAAEKKQLEEQLERERLAQEARLQRERDEANKRAEQERKAIEASRVKGTKKVWSFKVVNVSEVPREFLGVDETAIRKAINGGMHQIPGLIIWQDTVVALSSRSTAIGAQKI